MKTQGEWTVLRGKGDELHEVRTLGGKIALVFELSDAKQIAREHNTQEQLVEACEDAFHAIKSEQLLQASRGESVAADLGVAIGKLDRALEAARATV